MYDLPDTQEASACIINHPSGQAAFDAYLSTLPSWHEQRKLDAERWNRLFEELED